MTEMTRRSLLKAGRTSGVGAVISHGLWPWLITHVPMTWPAVARGVTGPEEAGDVCLIVSNQWSYIGIGWEIVGPSPLPSHDNDPPPHALSTTQIREIQAAFAAATVRALQAGYQWFEVHGAVRSYHTGQLGGGSSFSCSIARIRATQA
jgi:hypothetical protein